MSIIRQEFVDYINLTTKSGDSSEDESEEDEEILKGKFGSQSAKDLKK
jgi:hypothetical protein